MIFSHICLYIITEPGPLLLRDGSVVESGPFWVAEELLPDGGEPHGGADGGGGEETDQGLQGLLKEIDIHRCVIVFQTTFLV